MKQLLETSVILLCAVVLNGKPVISPGKFPYSKCIQTSNGIFCEKLNITKGRHENPSLWPPGPYAIPMSRFGCPEWPSQGWKKGVLRMKEPPGRKELQQKFCVKTRHKANLDTGKWISGTFNIYKAGKTCPEGFVEFNRTRNFETFAPSEFTPAFTVVSESAKSTSLNTSKIQFQMCKRNSTNTSMRLSEYGMLQTEFVLETTGDEGDCLKLPGTLAWPETIEANMENRHCSYTPIAVKKSSGEILDFRMSKGDISSSGKKSDDKNLVWYQFDMRRTLSLYQIVVKIDSAMQEIITESIYVECFYDNVVWSFLHGVAFECNAETSFSPQKIKFYIKLKRKLQARYITLVFDETSGHQIINSKESVQIFLADLPHGVLCNEDLGMTDGRIKDFQITASSWLREHSSTKPLSTKWCTDGPDTTPWMLVDLISVTLIDGISIWNIGTSHYPSIETDKGCSSFYLYHGTTSEEIFKYNDMNFDIKLPVAEVQTFILLNPIKARYVKLEFHGCLGKGSRCVKFELQGCKLSGLLKLSCSKASKMIELETAITTERKPVIQNDSSTAESCSSSCLQNENCSVARYDGYCMHYPVGHFGMWQFTESWSGKLYAKLCAQEPVGLFPTLYYPGSAVATNLEIVDKDAIIATIGYPFPYDGGQHYRWLLQFPSNRFIRLVFTDVSLGYIHQNCCDTLHISKYFKRDMKGKEIDHLYNGRGFVVETSESVLFLSFISCLIQRKVTERGFRAIITGEEIPACLSLDSDMLWSEGRNEVCTEPTMLVSSMSVLNLPFVNVEENWQIRAGDHHSIQLQITDFYVVCSRVSGENSSKFEVGELSEEKVYCNADTPPDVIFSKTSRITIRFHRYENPGKTFIRTEGFRLRYSVINHSFENLKDTNASTKVCSKSFRKCYHIISSAKSWDEAAERCWEGDLQLVSVYSQYEMEFIHYLLRELRSRDRTIKKEHHNSTISFTAHVGLRRRTNSFRKNIYIWEHSSPVTFSAWKEHNPVDGKDCTRTNFQYFTNETWESEHCTTDLAQYFVCQSFMGAQKNTEEIKEDHYWCPDGWIENRKTCYYVYKHWFTWDNALKYCANAQSKLLDLNDDDERKFVSMITRGDGYYWRIHIKDPETVSGVYAHFVCEKEIATIENNCENVVWKIRKTNGFTYRGSPCQIWNELTKTAKKDFESRFPNLDVPSEDSGSCQDPDNSGILWCYNTLVGKHLWEPCFMQRYVDCVEAFYCNAKTIGRACLHNAVSHLPHVLPVKNHSIFCRKIILFSMEDNAESVQNTSNDKFECEDGSEIPIFRQCDGVVHCKDFSDELLCSSKEHHLTNNSEHLTERSHRRLEKTSLYLCGSNEWISMLAKCDDVIDCKDASDEMNCSRPYEGCESCNDSTSDPTSQACTFMPQCIQAEEDFRELRPCLYDEYTCGNKQCIPLNKRCNGNEDCVDGSDEIQCDSCKESFHCDDNKCIPLRLTYDTYPDCDDGSDVMKRSVESLTSCDQWWEHGYRTSGKYVIDDIPVFCDFSSMKKSGKITMLVRNIDVDTDTDRGVIYTQSLAGDYLQFNDTKLQSIVFRDDYTCFLEVRSSCQFHYAASMIDESNVFHKCQCTLDKFKATKQTHEKAVQVPNGSDLVWETKETTVYKFVRYQSAGCKGGEQDGHPAISKRYYNVTSANDISVDNRILRNEIPVQIGPWHITCTFEHSTPTTNGVVSCEDDEDVLPCVYDVDGAGFMTGCRTGSHLQNCGNYSCPPQTVKCPGSYCIPLRFVCDGNIQCPGGEDEYECACTNTTRAVLILVEDAPDQTGGKKAATKLATQLYTTGSDIRILRYRTETSLTAYDIDHRLLEIQEERFRPFQRLNRMRKCLYKTMARNFFGNVEFSIQHSKGVIFVEGSTESSKVGRLMFSNLSKPAFEIYRVFKDIGYSLIQSKLDVYKFVKDVPIKSWNSLFSTGYKRFPEICEAATQVSCSGGYRCASSKQCIPVEQICDGIAQCNFKDDERLCDVICPDNCTCAGYVIDCRDANLEYSVVKLLSVGTQRADLSRNPEMSVVLMKKTLRFPFMVNLNLSSCQIEIVNRNGFFDLKNLKRLDISYNRIKRLKENTFSDLTKLANLHMDGNFRLETISAYAFYGLRNIRTLRITGTKVKQIVSYTFAHLTLQAIDISYNEISEIENFAFYNISVEKIDFRGNNILSFNKNIFRGVSLLQELKTPAYKFCCIRPCYVEDKACHPGKNEFSSCADLIRHPVLQAVLWLVGITAILGNIASIIYRLVYDRKRLKIGYGIFVTNLAAADFLMGIYLIMIAITDAVYRSRYIFMDEEWRNSSWCVIAGVLSTVSSEASVLFLCLITLDRLLVIKYPFGTVRFGSKRAHIFCVVSWVISFTLALIPVFYTGYFQNKFYSRSGVCVALPLTRDKPPGWIYSVSIFVGLNFCTFILVAFGQISIFVELRKATSGMTKTMSSRKRDLQVARNLILVATTDFLCWFPIGLMGIMALSGYPIPGDVYAWTVVFILPLNSALNPVLYTLTAIIGKQSFNPSTEEQARAELQTEKGLAVLKHHTLIPSVRLKSENVPIRTLQSVHNILSDKRPMPTATAVAIGLQLSKYLCLLHESSMSIDKLSEHTVFVKMNKEKKQKVKIVLDSTIAVTNDEKKIQDNIYQFGILLRRLLAK